MNEKPVLYLFSIVGAICMYILGYYYFCLSNEVYLPSGNGIYGGEGVIPAIYYEDNSANGMVDFNDRCTIPIPDERLYITYDSTAQEWWHVEK